MLIIMAIMQFLSVFFSLFQSFHSFLEKQIILTEVWLAGDHNTSLIRCNIDDKAIWLYLKTMII